MSQSRTEIVPAAASTTSLGAVSSNGTSRPSWMVCILVFHVTLPRTVRSQSQLPVTVAVPSALRTADSVQSGLELGLEGSSRPHWLTVLVYLSQARTRTCTSIRS